MTDSEEGSTAFSKSLPRAVCPSTLCTILPLKPCSATLVEFVRYVATKLHLVRTVKLLEWHARLLVGLRLKALGVLRAVSDSTQ
ncbi:hypothetical protein E4T44_08643 [Aureobasidium sp. EXF-8845]|nr:hypothetical protein E4T44_08643 [Aureobasidium sp. EXF-8845]KAI4843825.1 hypothetical protein E4T45_08428 [Aureobasidium sp. EXF-8846]